MDSSAEFPNFPVSGYCPWLQSDYSFAGWVPTILGHLSFSVVGVKHNWRQSRTYNDLNTTSSERSVLTIQRRISQDFPFWDWIVRIFKPSAVQEFVLLAQTAPSKVPVLEGKEVRTIADSQGVLVGCVYVIPHQEDVEGKWDRENLILSLSEKTRKISNPSQFSCKAIAEEMAKFSESILIHKIHFALFRTGEIRLWADEREMFGSAHADADTLAAQKVLAKSLPKQVYYFVKDTAHCHYHHEDNSDQILPLVSFDSVSPRHEDDTHRINERAWRREVLWGLARVVARYRREGDIKQLKRAQGMLAYADAFQSTLGRLQRSILVDGDPKHDDDLTTYDFAHAKQSVTALDGLRSWHNSGHVQIFAAIIAILVSAFSIWNASFKMVESACQTTALIASSNICENYISNRALTVAALISKHPLIFTGFLAIPIGVFYSICVKDLRDLYLIGRPMTFFTTAAKAAGAGMSQRFNSPTIGFFVLIAILIVFAAIFSFLFFYMGTHMQGR